MKVYTGVGSSTKTPESILEVMVRGGKMAADLGYALRSGHAYRSDRAFEAGGQQSCRYYSLENRIYLAWNGIGRDERVYHDPSKCLYDATRFESVYEVAKSLALQARGSFDNLGRGGIALHTRNAFQVMGDALTEPSRFVLYYAWPYGNKGQVSGGTNTAIQIAKRFNIPTYNLFYEPVLDVLLRELEIHERTSSRGDYSKAKRFIDPRDLCIPEPKRSTGEEEYQVPARLFLEE